jgi:hypothetical protein
MKKLIIICAALLLASPAFGAYHISNSDYTNPYTTDEFTRGLWHFDHSSGTNIYTDSSGNGNDGQIGVNPFGRGMPYPATRYVDVSNTLTWQAGYFNNAFTVGTVSSVWNGGSSAVAQGYAWTQTWPTGYDTVTYQDTGNNTLAFSPGTDMTIEFWMKADATGGGGWGDRMMGKYTGGDHSVNFNDNKIDIGCYQGGWTGFDSGQDTVSLDVWTHVAVVIDRTTLSDTDRYAFFFNGQIGSEGWQEAPYSGHGGNAEGKPLFIGAPYNFDAYSCYQGQIDELRISDVCRYIPEPTTISLLAIAALAFLRRKK